MSNILLSLTNVTKRYGNTEVLHGINLEILAGEVFSLLGVNGAGKTTLSSIIATLHPLSSGDIIYRNQSIYKNLINFRQKIGYCPQKPNLFAHLTLRQNLVLAGQCYGLADEVIEERIRLLSQQFNLVKYLDQYAQILSGGYKQRFMIVRSLLHQPELIILDEPTVGLDPQVRRQLWDLIKVLRTTGVTVLLTTHYLDEAEKLSDRVCILDQGLVKLIDTPDQLMADFKRNNLEDVFIELLKASQT